MLVDLTLVLAPVVRSNVRLSNIRRPCRYLTCDLAAGAHSPYLIGFYQANTADTSPVPRIPLDTCKVLSNDELRAPFSSKVQARFFRRVDRDVTKPLM